MTDHHSPTFELRLGCYSDPRSDSAVGHLGTYRRWLPVGLERLYENVLDWEHLPHLHRSSFSALECLAWGAWGWRARVADSRQRWSVVEVHLDRDLGRWITRTLEGQGAGTEAWTWVQTRAQPHAHPAAGVGVVVDFFAPALPAQRRRRAGIALAGFYETLYDEDVAMMTERQRMLDRRIDRAREPDRSLDLGPRAALKLPCTVSLAGRDFVVAEAAGEVVAFPARCPHQLGPLGGAPLDGTVVTCPWHGDRFDVSSGDNLSGRACRLSHLPRVEWGADGHLRLTATH